MTTYSVWKNQIIVNWHGPLPSGVETLPKLLLTWKHIRDFAKYSERLGGFFLTLSLQNIARLQAQFGQLSWRSGGHRIHELEEKAGRFTEMVATAVKVKTLPFERLPKYEYKVPPLDEYQHRGVVYLCNVKLAPLFWGCGLGKSFAVLVSTERQIKLGILKPGKTLIVGKLTTLETGWLEDAAKFTNLKVVSLWLPQGTKRKEKFLERLKENADIYLTNHDSIRVFKDALVERCFDKVVLDESTVIKSFKGMHRAFKGGALGRALLEVSQHAQWRVIMSGTPAPNGVADLWGQAFFLDADGILLEPNFHNFQNEYLEMVDLRPRAARYRKDDNGKSVFIPPDGRSPKKWLQKSDAADRVGALINPLAFRAKIDDHLKLPPLTVMTRLIDMDKEQARHYKDMEKRLRVELNDVRITVPIMLAKLGKLRQLTGGFIIGHDEVVHKLPVNPKLEELASLLEEIGDNKVVIFAQFREEIETITARYANTVAVYGGNSSEANLLNIKKFISDPGTRMLVAHPRSAGWGITFTVAHYLIFYSISHSAEEVYQGTARIKRASQEHAMFAYFLLMRGTIDCDAYAAVQLKNNNQEELLDAGQLLVNLWRKHAG